MKKIIIASKNPVKIKSVKIGFEGMFPGKEFEFIGVSVPSDVSDQPLSDGETLAGAANRCRNARDEFAEADFWIGIEGGTEKHNAEEMAAFAWVVIESGKLAGKGRTGTFFLPRKVVDLIHEGKELGEADDIVFGRKNSKQKAGAVGILTGDVIDRTKLYTEAVILALIPFKNPEIFEVD
jgi:inosine/xanthosine triphosphatase